MKIEITKTKKNAALLKSMASDDFIEAYKARQAFAAYITEPVQDVIEAYPGLQQLYEPYTYEYGQPALIPLAPLFDIKEAGFFRVWAQSRPGGLATSSNVDVSEFPVMTFERQGAVSIPLTFVRSANTGIVAKYLRHLSQNFLVRSETDKAEVIANMAATTTYKLRGTDTRQVYRTLNQGTVLPQDINAGNRIMTRVNTANVGGTPAGAGRSITHLVGSPEFVEGIRNLAWEPTNNVLRATYPLAGPEAWRNAEYDAAGEPSFLGTRIIVLNDLGTNQPYNILFANAAGNTAYAGYAGSGTAAFSPGSEQVVYAIDRRIEGLASISEVNPDTGANMRVLADNQFSSRAETIGFYAKKREGYAGCDGRGLVALVF